jgi:hypothetical protein
MAEGISTGKSEEKHFLDKALQRWTTYGIGCLSPSCRGIPAEAADPKRPAFLVCVD